MHGPSIDAGALATPLYPEKSPEERLRDEGFRAVRVATGEYLARELPEGDIALDAYMVASGQYPAIAVNWLKLKAFAPDIDKASRILDLTCGTGTVSSFLLQTMPGRMKLTANEVSPELRRIAARTLEFYLGSSKDGGPRASVSSFNPSSDDLFNEHPDIGRESFDLILWWGSFQTLAGRGQGMSNAFDLLRPGGRFVIMDVYPSFPIPFSFVGAEGAKFITFVSCPLDMGHDVKGWVNDKWIAKAVPQSGTNPYPRIEVIEFAEQLSGTILPSEYWGELRSLCFKKPCR